MSSWIHANQADIKFPKADPNFNRTAFELLQAVYLAVKLERP